MPLTRRQFLAASIPASALPVRSFQQGTPAASPQAATPAEDGYELWLRYRLIADSPTRESYAQALNTIVSDQSHPVLDSAISELTHGLGLMIGATVARSQTLNGDGALVIGTPDTSALIASDISAGDLASLGTEGYLIRSTTIDGFAATVIASNGFSGVLYGAFRLLSLVQMRQPITHLALTSAPRTNFRMVNHWDNLDRTVTRGYAGLSIFHWDELPRLRDRYTDYARTLASIGINTTAINDVDADAQMLSSDMLKRLGPLAEVLAAWGISLFLCPNYASPMYVTAPDHPTLKTADPSDPDVQKWWHAKAKEIYQLIPTFGGYLVKANSEGMPGPITYGHTHAEGANMLARTLKPYRGNVIWRSFVHKGYAGWSELEYQTFQPLDGAFDDNVALQTKNGPIDFQVREPVNPLFGAMPKTPQLIELQITQEYTGHATHLCYLPAQWRWVLDFDTRYHGTGPTVAEIVDGTHDNLAVKGFAGVINIGDDRDWTGSLMAAANLHGFGRLAWDHTAKVDGIAQEWAMLTFGPAARNTIATITTMLTNSWTTYEAYTSPLGVGYMTYPLGAHFDPDPESTENLSHVTDAKASGLDRTLATGSGYTRLYSDAIFDQYEHLDTCPDELKMFMHRVPWDHRLASGKTAIQHIYDTHFDGADAVATNLATWRQLASQIDADRHRHIETTLTRQVFHARRWRDRMNGYYFTRSRLLDSRRKWVSLFLSENPPELRGGVENTLPVFIGNATPTDQSLTLTIDPAMDGWTSSTERITLPSTHDGHVDLRLTPPVTPYYGPMTFAVSPQPDAVLGSDTEYVMVAPDASQCHVAFDCGAVGRAPFSGYEPLTSLSVWGIGGKVGWINGAPKDHAGASHWPALQGTFCWDSQPRTLRPRLPAGPHTFWVLTGGQGVGTSPIVITHGTTALAHTGYLEEGAFEWLSFVMDGGPNGGTVDITIAGADGRNWRMAALTVLLSA